MLRATVCMIEQCNTVDWTTAQPRYGMRTLTGSLVVVGSVT